MEKLEYKMVSPRDYRGGCPFYNRNTSLWTGMSQDETDATYTMRIYSLNFLMVFKTVLFDSYTSRDFKVCNI